MVSSGKDEGTSNTELGHLEVSIKWIELVSFLVLHADLILLGEPNTDVVNGIEEVHSSLGTDLWITESLDLIDVMITERGNCGLTSGKLDLELTDDELSVSEVESDIEEALLDIESLLDPEEGASLGILEVLHELLELVNGPDVIATSDAVGHPFPAPLEVGLFSLIEHFLLLGTHSEGVLLESELDLLGEHLSHVGSKLREKLVLPSQDMGGLHLWALVVNALLDIGVTHHLGGESVWTLHFDITDLLVQVLAIVVGKILLDLIAEGLWHSWSHWVLTLDLLHSLLEFHPEIVTSEDLSDDSDVVSTEQSLLEHISVEEEGILHGVNPRDVLCWDQWVSKVIGNSADLIKHEALNDVLLGLSLVVVDNLVLKVVSELLDVRPCEIWVECVSLGLERDLLSFSLLGETRHEGTESFVDEWLWAHLVGHSLEELLSLGLGGLEVLSYVLVWSLHIFFLCNIRKLLIRAIFGLNTN